MRISEADDDEKLEFNLAPMIDIVFLLLIFFMVATTFVEREKELGVDLPQAASGDPAWQQLDEIVINLMSDGSMIYQGSKIEHETLIEMLTEAAEVNPDTPVTIRGDKEVYHQYVVSVMDACRVAGLTNLGVMALDG